MIGNATGNDKLKDLGDKVVNVVDEAKDGDITGAISAGVEGNEKLEDFSGMTDQIVKQVQNGDKFDAIKTATEGIADQIGGEAGQDLKKNVGGLTDLTESISNKDAAASLDTTIETMVN